MSNSDAPSLRTLRNRVGPNTRKGHLLSNLIKQEPWLRDDTGDRSWATHPTQSIRWLMEWQIRLLAR